MSKEDDVFDAMVMLSVIAGQPQAFRSRTPRFSGRALQQRQ